jgi:hypothetical protein
MVERGGGVDETLPAASSDAPSPSARALEDLPQLPVVEPSVYVRGAEIARGGMGRLHAARDRRVGRPVAVKELLDPSPAAAVRFEREALVTARLQHPAIVPVYEAGRWPSGEPFYAMKHVAGSSLDAVVAARRSLRERIALVPHVIAVADALAYAHSRRIIHRDLKPANVLVGDFGETVVIDWGLAKDLGAPAEDEAAEPARGDGSLTVAGQAMGTPAYMPPEQARGEPVDERADVYALGAMLYHVLAGRMPYAASSAQETLRLVELGPPRPLREVEPGVPPELFTIVDKAMARDPARRYPTARQLAEDLRRYQTGQLVSAHVYTMGALVGRWVRRHRAVMAMAALMLVAVAATSAVAVARVVRARGEAERERARAEEGRREAVRAREEAEQRRSQAARAAEALVEAWARAEHEGSLAPCFVDDGEVLIELEIGDGGAARADLMKGEGPPAECALARARTWSFPAATLPGLYGLTIRRSGPDLSITFARVDKDYLRAKIKARFLAGMEACYQELLRVEPNAAGVVKVSFAIEPDGTVTIEKIASFDARMAACVRERASTWRFPRPEQRIEATYPFEFGRHP